MGANTSIRWTHHTFNPWLGCAKVSEGCRNCYAETLTTNRMGLRVWGLGAQRKITAASTWAEPLRLHRQAEKARERRRVFCASMADVFEDRPDLREPRARLFRMIEETPWFDWLLLTKRPESMVRLAAEAGWTGPWPSSVWVGCTVESQKMAHARIPHLLDAPARIRFLSVEPLLGPLNLDPPLCQHCGDGSDIRADDLESAPWCADCKAEAVFGHWLDTSTDVRQPGIDWVICGGESGGQARPFDLAWARSLRDQCQDAGVAFLFKQLGDNPVVRVDGKLTTWPSKAPKGGDPAEWPEDLRVQQFPEALYAA
jgi:protein gp37